MLMQQELHVTNNSLVLLLLWTQQGCGRLVVQCFKKTNAHSHTLEVLGS